MSLTSPKTTRWWLLMFLLQLMLMKIMIFIFHFFIILNLKTTNVADNDRQAGKKTFFFFLIIFIFIFHKKFMILIYKRNNTMCIKYMWLRKMTRDSSLFHQVPPATSSVFWGLFLMLSLSSKEINKKPACVQITCAHPRILAKANLATRPLLCTKLFFPNTTLATCPNG